MTDVYEGSLIRLFRRLEELLRQIAQASKVMGSEELEQKFTAALELVRRDLVSASGDLHTRCSLLTLLAGGCPVTISLSEVTGTSACVQYWQRHRLWLHMLRHQVSSGAPACAVQTTGCCRKGKRRWCVLDSNSLDLPLRCGGCMRQIPAAILSNSLRDVTLGFVCS
jgi:hypothetical protein